MAEFEAQLKAKGGDKEQRAAVRQLIARAGGDEVRAGLWSAILLVHKGPQFGPL
jgi:hypothetical protein